MRNVMVITTEKMLNNSHSLDLIKKKVSFETLFLGEFDKFISDMKTHEEQYSDADSWLTNKRDEYYLLEKIKMTKEFYKCCKKYRHGMKAEGLFFIDAVEISS